MAYDLFLRSHVLPNYARGDEPARKTSPIVSAISFGVAGVTLLLPSYLRHKENSEYRNRFSTDHPAPVGSHRSYEERRLRTTMEVPVVPMRELVYGRQQTT